jgi:cell division protein ZapA (FtsZ GTPase activity inhibitor)
VSRSVKVSLAGHKLRLKTDAKPRYVKELTDYVNAKIDQARASGKIVTTQALALMAALTIADELHQARAEKSELEKQVRERAQRILRTLEAEERASSTG